jgi:hypothetical protein
MVTRVQKSIKDSKLRKQFNIRAKNRKIRKDKKTTGELTKYVDKRELKNNKKKPKHSEDKESADENIEHDPTPIVQQPVADPHPELS